MNIKRIFLSLLVILMVSEGLSQSPEPETDPDYFYVEDALWGGEHYLLACKELDKKGKTVYQFEFSISQEAVITFEMVDIKPSNKTISIFQVEILNALDELHPNTEELISKPDSTHIEEIANDISEDNPSLTLEERNFINELIDETALKYEFDIRTLREGILPISQKLAEVGNPDDSIALQEKMSFAQAFSITHKADIKNQVKLSSSEYLFNVYLKSIEISDLAPDVGVLYANQKARVKRLSPEQSQSQKSNTPKEKNDSLAIEKVEVEFEYEQISGIKVTGTLENKAGRKTRLIFQNRIPISYSTKADVSRDKGVNRGKYIRLFSVENFCPAPDESEKCYPIYITMDEVFRNDYRLLNQTENYSPKDQVITFKPGQKGTVVKKEKATNLLKAKIFSDIVGFNSSQPNGLIQTEFSHRFYFNTRVHQIRESYYYFGFANSAMPKITLTKIESNNRILDLNTKPLAGDTVQLFVGTMDLFRHTSWTSGGEVNIGFLGLPYLQSTLYLNVGAYVRNVSMRIPSLEDEIYYPPFQDKQVDDERKFSTNIAALFPELTLSVSPHSRFRLTYNAKLYYLFSFTDDFSMVSHKNNFLLGEEDIHPWVLSLKFLAALRISNEANGELFFRSYFNFLPGYASQNFFQAQIGYAFNIFDSKNGPAPPQPLEDL